VGLFEGIAVDTVGILEGSIDGTTDGVSEARMPLCTQAPPTNEGIESVCVPVIVPDKS